MHRILVRAEARREPPLERISFTIDQIRFFLKIRMIDQNQNRGLSGVALFVKSF